MPDDVDAQCPCGGRARLIDAIYHPLDEGVPRVAWCAEGRHALVLGGRLVDELRALVQDDLSLPAELTELLARLAEPSGATVSDTAAERRRLAELTWRHARGASAAVQRFLDVDTGIALWACTGVVRSVVAEVLHPSPPSEGSCRT